MSSLWPFALTMATVGAAGVAVERRRRERLNRALHELRRPLQALALRHHLAPEPTGEDSLDLALLALADLDQEINGGEANLARRPVSGRALVEAAVERWRGTAPRGEARYLPGERPVDHALNGSRYRAADGIRASPIPPRRRRARAAA